MSESKKNAAVEDLLFFEGEVVPALAKLQAGSREDRPSTEFEFEGDPMELSPEQEIEVYKKILRSRGQNVD